MKKGILLMLFMALLVTVQAQTEKGNYLLGFGTAIGIGENEGLMGLAFSNSTIKDGNATVSETKLTSLFITTKAGYFVADNLAAGLDLAGSFSSGSSSVASFDLESQNSFIGIGPFVRYYFPTGKILPFAEVNTIFGNRNQSTAGQGVDIENKYAVSNFGGGLGLAFLLGEKSSLDLGLNYNSTNMNQKGTEIKNSQNTLGLRLSFTVYL